MARTARVIQAIAGEEDGNGQWYRATDLWYDTSGRLWLSRLQRYHLIEDGDPPEVQIDLDTRQYLAAMEYRYDSGRQRYMVRPRDAETLEPPWDGVGAYDLDIGAWHDYSGASINGDYAVEAVWDGQHQMVTSANVTETIAHEPGVGFIDRTNSDAAAYHHGDQINSARLLTDDGGVVGRRIVYTAFGEPVYSHGTIGTRYEYAGAWGYESELYFPADGNNVPFLHVGHRWYDPSTGRFLQRDPIGIRGGLNTYMYVFSNPVLWVDPLGLEHPSRGPLGGPPSGPNPFGIHPAEISRAWQNYFYPRYPSPPAACIIWFFENKDDICWYLQKGIDILDSEYFKEQDERLEWKMDGAPGHGF